MIKNTYINWINQWRVYNLFRDFPFFTILEFVLEYESQEPTQKNRPPQNSHKANITLSFLNIDFFIFF